MTVFECAGLSRRFGGVTAVNDLSFAVEEGEILGLIGPNGAGKTTVFNLMTGFYRPNSGSMRYKGKDLSALTPPEIVNSGIARTFQNIRLFSNLTVADNVCTVLYRYARYGYWEALVRSGRVRRDEAVIREAALSHLEEVGLRSRAAERASALPYGFQRKLELARALALEPDLLLLDEPAAGMNPEESMELVDLIRRLQEKHKFTIILIEHHMDVVMSLCHRIVVMNFGEKLMEGSPEEVQSDARVIEAYLGEEYASAHRR
ncbi:MAG: ABC transporter ATP-binding protein [Bacillota bacterium]